MRSRFHREIIWLKEMGSIRNLLYTMPCLPHTSKQSIGFSNLRAYWGHRRRVLGYELQMPLPDKCVCTRCMSRSANLTQSCSAPDSPPQAEIQAKTPRLPRISPPRGHWWQFMQSRLFLGTCRPDPNGNIVMVPPCSDTRCANEVLLNHPDRRSIRPISHRIYR